MDDVDSSPTLGPDLRGVVLSSHTDRVGPLRACVAAPCAYDSCCHCCYYRKVGKVRHKGCFGISVRKQIVKTWPLDPSGP